MTTGMVFPYLEELTIYECGQLKSAPCHFPSLTKLEIFTICNTAFGNISSKLTTLTSLYISHIPEIDFLPGKLFQNNTSLMSLTILNCANLVSISPHQDVWTFCTSRRTLRIYNCEKFSYLPDALHNLRSLEKFQVSSCPNLRFFPSVEGVASFLQRLEISCGVEFLPAGLQSCTSLQY